MTLLTSLGHWGGWLTGYVVPFLFVLTIVVFFHELGHFLIARWCGVRVLVFSIGFGPELIGFNDRHGTRWKISAIPLGGYVKFFGDENVASVADQGVVATMSAAERNESFFFKPVAKRAAIVVAGPVANFVLAILIFGGIVMIAGKQVTTPRIDSLKAASAAATAGFKKGDLIVAIDGKAIESFSDAERIIALNPGHALTFTVERGGQRVAVTVTPELREERDRFNNVHRIGRLDIGGPVIRARVGSIQPGSAAAAAGLELGDVIESINGMPIESFNELRTIVLANPETPLSLSVLRNGRTVTLTATPAVQTEKNPDGTPHRVGMLGISGTFDPGDVKFVHYSPVAALGAGVEETWFVIDRTVAYIGGVVAGRESADQLGGPIRIAQVSGQVASAGFVALINLAAVLSVSIGLLNLFPIPLLDGGHLLFYAIEAARGRPLSDRAQEVGFRIGLAIVLMLMVFATFNDILHLAGS